MLLCFKCVYFLTLKNYFYVSYCFCILLQSLNLSRALGRKRQRYKDLSAKTFWRLTPSLVLVVNRSLNSLHQPQQEQTHQTYNHRYQNSVTHIKNRLKFIVLLCCEIDCWNLINKVCANTYQIMSSYHRNHEPLLNHDLWELTQNCIKY